MGQGGSKLSIQDAADKVDPRVGGRAGSKGALFRFIPDVGDPVLLIKTDNGFSTNWEALGGGSVSPITIVQAASVANIDLSNLPANIDGVVPVTFLAKNQTLPEENGVYNFIGVGLAATRASGWDTAADFTPGRQVFSDGGTVNADTMWLNADIVTTLGTDPIVFVSSGGGAIAGPPNAVAAYDSLGALTGYSDVLLKPNGRLEMGAAINQSGSDYVFAYGDGNRPIIASGPGALAKGRANDAGGIITASGFGATAQGHVRNGNASLILASGNGSLASGEVFQDGNLNATSFGSLSMGFIANGGTILASGVGSQAHGSTNASVIQATNTGAYATGFGNNGGTINASGIGASAKGLSDGGQILSSSDGSSASGTANSGILNASGQGSLVHGVAAGNGQVLSSGGGSVAFGQAIGANSRINASSDGAMAFGAANSDGSILAQLEGAFAFGATFSNGNIVAAQRGSHAYGVISSSSGSILANALGATAWGNNDGGGNISATSSGSEASGYVDGGTISASNFGSTARGFANGGFSISAAGRGSYAGGLTTIGSVGSVNNGSFSHGDLINNAADLGTVFGLGLNNTSFASLVIGRYNLITANDPNAWQPTDPVFVVGNGTGVGSESNGYQIDKDGRQKTTASHVDRIVVVAAITGDYAVNARGDFKVVVDNNDGLPHNLTLPAGEEGLNFKLVQADTNTATYTIVATGGDVLDANIQSIFDTNQPVPVTFTSGKWYAI